METDGSSHDTYLAGLFDLLIPYFEDGLEPLGLVCLSARWTRLAIRKSDTKWRTFAFEMWEDEPSVLQINKGELWLDVVLRIAKREYKNEIRARKTQEYWDKQFSSEDGQREWLAPYDSFRDILLAQLSSRASKRILVIGNGVSNVPRRLWDDGLLDVVVTDVSGASKCHLKPLLSIIT